MFSRYVAHIFSEWLWNSPSCPYYCWYHLCFYIPHALYFYCKVFFYFKIFSASFLITFLSPEIATSTNIHVPFSLTRIIMSGLLLGIVLSVCTCWFHNLVTLPPWLVSTELAHFIIIIIIVVVVVLLCCCCYFISLRFCLTFSHIQFWFPHFMPCITSLYIASSFNGLSSIFAWCFCNFSPWISPAAISISWIQGCSLCIFGTRENSSFVWRDWV